MLPILFKTFVRPHLKYGNLIWSPFNGANIKLIEQVQQRATRLVGSIRSKPYAERLKCLKLPSLLHRRRRGDMIGMYQLCHEEVDIDVDDFVKRASTSRNRGHPWKLYKPHARSRARRQLLTIRAINDWNSLPVSVVKALSLNSIKFRLDQHWANLMYEITS